MFNFEKLDFSILNYIDKQNLIDDILWYSEEEQGRWKPNLITYNNLTYSDSDRENFRIAILKHFREDFFSFQETLLSSFLINKVTWNLTPSWIIHKDIIKNIFRKDFWTNKDWIPITTKTVIIVPRWHWKTTTIMHSLIFDIVFEIEESILYIASEGLWLEMLWKIRVEFEVNDRLKFVFGRLVPTRKKTEQSKKWKATELHFLSWVVLQTTAKGGSVRWKRPTKLVVDDPQEDKEVEKKEVTDKFNKRFFGSLYNTLVPWGTCVVVGTIIWNLCFVNHLAENDYWYKVIKFDAVQNPEYVNVKNKAWREFIGWTPLWDSMWSLETLNEQKRSVWEEIFDQEFMNIPYITVWGRVFNKDYNYNIIWDYIEPHKYTYKDRKYVSLPEKRNHWKIYWPPTDALAIGIDNNKWWHQGDYAGITVWARNPNRVIATFQAKYDDLELAEELDWFFWYDYYTDIWNPAKAWKKYLWTILAENNLWQALFDNMKQFNWFYQRVLKERNKDWIIDEVQNKYWFRTSESSKNYIISQFRSALRWWGIAKSNNWLKSGIEAEPIQITRDIKHEIDTYYYDDNYKANAIDPYYDDLLMSAMIWHHNLLHERYILHYDKVNTFYGEDMTDFQRDERKFFAKLAEQTDFESFWYETIKNWSNLLDNI